MALINCPECGKQVSDKASMCPNCGCPVEKEVKINECEVGATCCPVCGGKNISYQREQSTTVGGAKHSYSASSRHGLFYWLFFGWWILIFKMMFKMILAVCTCGISLLFHKKEKIASGTTISAGKHFNHTIAVCQSCGHSWKV